MNPSFATRASAAAAFLATAAFFLLALFGGTANADEISGTATITIGTGKSGKMLSGKKGKVTAINPAEARKLRKQMTQVQVPVKTLSVATNSKSTLAGGIQFRNGKRKVVVTGLELSFGAENTLIKGKLGGKAISLFTANGKSTTDLGEKTVKVNSARLNLTAAAGKKLGKALKLRKRPSGTVGDFSFFGKVTETTPVDPCVADPAAEGCGPDPLTDPYLAQCGVEATSQGVPGLPVAPALPTLAGAKSSTAPTTFDWGFKASFRGYIKFAAGGSLHALDGAARDGVSPVSGFRFNVADGSYSSNSTPELGDDQAIINGTGTSLFCGTEHGFRLALSNPTVVIDGSDSRIIADVDTNLTGVWTPAQRVDVADLVLGAGEPTSNGSPTEITWTAIPATLSEALDGVIPGYSKGAALDPITVGVTVAGE